MFSINWEIWGVFKNWEMGTTWVFAPSGLLASLPSAFPQVSKIDIYFSAHSDEILFCASSKARGWERCTSFSSPTAFLCPSRLFRAWAWGLPVVWENSINTVHFNPWGFHLLHCNPGCYKKSGLSVVLGDFRLGWAQFALNFSLLVSVSLHP